MQHAPSYQNLHVLARVLIVRICVDKVLQEELGRGCDKEEGHDALSIKSPLISSKGNIARWG